jgi:hypothetical protein
MKRATIVSVLLFSLAAGMSGCGFCGTEQWVDAARSPKVIANNEMTDDQRAVVKDKKILKDDEVIIWYYDASLSGNGDEANILTTKRAAMYDESGVYRSRSTRSRISNTRAVAPASASGSRRTAGSSSS